MYLRTTAFEELLKCSFCSSRFSSGIKLIPECGNSICQSCHDELIKEAKETTQYVCKECGEKHSMPENGLAENKALGKMLTLPAVEKPPNEQAEWCKMQVKELQAKIDKLKTFNVQEELGIICESLEREVMAAADEAFSHLNRIVKKLLMQIGDYKESFLASNQEERPAKRFKSAISPAQEEISSLSMKIAQLENQIQEMDNSNDGHVPATVFSQLSSLQSDYAQTQAKLKEEVFNFKSIRFEPNAHFGQRTEILGKIVIQDIAVGTIKQEVNTSPAVSEATSSQSTLILQLKEEYPKAGSIMHHLKGHTNCVRQVLFLPNGDLASCSDDRSIKVWNHQKGVMLYELLGSKSKVISMTAVPPNFLVSGCADSAIYVWNLDQRKLVHRVHSHINLIFSLQTLSNGQFVSASFDGSMKVWEIRNDLLRLIDTMKGHGIQLENNIGVLPNNQLITCSNNKDGAIRIWSINEKRVVRRLFNDTKEACALQVLKDCRVAFAFSNGQIKIYSLLAARINCVKIEAYTAEGRICLTESPSGALLSGGPVNDPSIKIWSTTTGQLIHRIHTSHASGISSLSFSNDGRALAVGSRDNTIKIIAFYSN